MAVKHGGLGRGLGALMRETPRTPPAVATGGTSPATGETHRIPISSIRANTFQPRHTFRTQPLDELVASIREHGVLQPLIVRPAADGYELIAGERRLRASQAAGLHDVPCRVMKVDDRGALELALIENLQREDLNPIEEAEGYQMLGDRFQLTQDQIAQQVGKARTTVTNALRLLTLPPAVRTLLGEGTLSPGHAKALLGLAIPDEQAQLARDIVKEGLSVREVERRVARLQRGGVRPRRVAREDVPAGHLRDMESKLREKLGTGVHASSPRTLSNGKKTKGEISIEYYTADDLDRLLILLGLSNEF